MINVSLSGWLLFFLFLALSCLSGIVFSRLLPWSKTSIQHGLDLASGLAIGAFLPGFGTILALGIFAGASHQTHLILIASFLTLILFGSLTLSHFGKDKPSFRFQQNFIHAPKSPMGILLIVAIVLFILLSIAVPLIQNDALEYNLVARELFHSRDLTTYPLLNSETNKTGFYGPWTHPPLYVALLYFAEIVQGHADSPGLTRLIAPWFALVCTGLVWALGRRLGDKVGLIAALFFLTTPLFFLGASSSLLDSLYVTGMALVIALIAGLHSSPLKVGVSVGIGVGLSLWTHSQAILILPIALAVLAVSYPLKNWRHWATACCGLFVVALLIGTWPYWRNMQIFGTPISDAPLVFQLSSLHWDDYFSTGRGLDTLTAKIQYGLLKGWFALEAYSFIFWMALIGIIFSLPTLKFGLRHFYLNTNYDSKKICLDIRFLCIIICIIYFIGIILSLFLDVDLMIKNERYLLIILPAVAILAGYGVSSLMVSTTQFIKKHSIFSINSTLKMNLLNCCLYAFLTATLLVLGVYTIITKNIGYNKQNRLDDKLVNIPNIRTVKFLDEINNDLGNVLSLKPADMYYSKKRHISYLDPRLLAFYKAKNKLEAFAILKQLKIGYIHVPAYTLPPYYNSYIQQILSDPYLTQLIIDEQGTQIYLLSSSTLKQTKKINIEPNFYRWNSRKYFLLSGRKKIGYLPLTAYNTYPAKKSELYLNGLFQRNVITKYHLGSEVFPASSELIYIREAKELLLEMQLSGMGATRINVKEYEAEKQKPVLLSTTLLGTFELSNTQSEREFMRRFRLSEKTKWLSVTIENNSTNNLRINFAHLTLYKSE